MPEAHIIVSERQNFVIREGKNFSEVNETVWYTFVATPRFCRQSLVSYNIQTELFKESNTDEVTGFQ
jgi:hypothetical protein